MTEAELKTAYEARRPALEALGRWVTHTVVTELEKKLGTKSNVEKFMQIPPKPRVKDVDSFLEKALIRKQKNNPLSEITDQVGVRFVVLLLRDIETVGEIVKAGPWRAEKDRDYQIERLEKPDYFAYQSDHYVVYTLRDIEFEGVAIPAGYSCEIQIRTILQHAYAEMAHSSSYKPPVKLPEADQKHVNRSLAKGSALIETTDDVFGEIKTKLIEHNKSVEALLLESSKIYEELTGHQAKPATLVGQIIADTYRELLNNKTPRDIRGWANQRDWLGKMLNEKRVDSVFYRDSVVILLGYLVTENETAIPRIWPVDSTYLEDFYTAVGVSTNGIF